MNSIPDQRPLRILLQTTIPFAKDDWSIERFSLLQKYLSSLQDKTGNPLFKVVARNREIDRNGDDQVLSSIDRSEFDELWLFAVDKGDGLSPQDCSAITRFRKRGGGILATRDHQDLGSSLCTLGGIGAAHFFHTHHSDPDPSRCIADDVENKSISWPNYHSGRNGDYQIIKSIPPLHELLRKPGEHSDSITFFPAHPHEGGVGVPTGEKHARVIATGISQTTHRPFNLSVAFERTEGSEGVLLGRGIAESSFHHFADYNWDTNYGAPSFVTELPGDGIQREPEHLNDIKTYVRNLAVWLAPA